MKILDYSKYRAKQAGETILKGDLIHRIREGLFYSRYSRFTTRRSRCDMRGLDWYPVYAGAIGKKFPSCMLSTHVIITDASTPKEGQLELGEIL